MDREALAEHEVGVAEGRLDVAVLEVERGEHVVGHVLEYPRGPGLHRLLGVHDGGELLVVDLDQVEGVLGEAPGLGGHRGDGLAGVDGLLHGHGVLLDGIPRPAAHGVGQARQLLPGQGRHHPLKARRLRDIYPLDVGVGVRAPEHRGVERPLELDVVGVEALPLHEPAVLLGLDRLADPSADGGRAHGGLAPCTGLLVPAEYLSYAMI